MTWGRTEEQQRWIDDAERAEKERAAAKCETRRLDPTIVDQLRAELQREITALRSEMAQQKELIFDAVGQALGEISNKVCDRFEASINKLRRMKIF
jgi:F0F1-type ATP synthase membrane subunit b/b'